MQIIKLLVPISLHQKSISTIKISLVILEEKYLKSQNHVVRYDVDKIELLSIPSQIEIY